MNDIAQIIATVGFPIFSCCAIGWFFARVNDNYRSDIKELSSSHAEEMSKITEAINNNSLVIQKLIDRMEADDNEQ